MSRTDVHRPWHVQVADPYNRHRLRRHAYWPALGMEWVPLYSICSCWMCHGWRGDQRRDRHQAQRLCREAIKDREEWNE